MQTGAGIVTGQGENTKFLGLLMGKINGKELEKRCATCCPAHHELLRRNSRSLKAET